MFYTFVTCSAYFPISISQANTHIPVMQLLFSRILLLTADSSIRLKCFLTLYIWEAEKEHTIHCFAVKMPTVRDMIQVSHVDGRDWVLASQELQTEPQHPSVGCIHLKWHFDSLNAYPYSPLLSITLHRFIFPNLSFIVDTCKAGFFFKNYLQANTCIN